MTMKNRRTVLSLILLGVLCCGAMALVGGVLRPGYGLKSALKIGVFFFLPLLLWISNRRLMLWQVFRPKKKGLLAALGLGVGLYGLILGGYYVVRNYFDFSGIVDSLSQHAGVNKDNFLFVSLYISFANSLLEEFFFRGFLFANLTACAGRKTGYLVSSVLFAAYHVAMMIGWFSLPLFLLVMAGLLMGGMIFCRLNEKLGSIYPSWFVHMFANFAINTIGFILMLG